MKVVVDVMGTDNRPGPDVAGALLAAAETNETIVLVGDKALIDKELALRPGTLPANIEVVHADDMILMDDKPGEVVKQKPHSSMHVGMALVQSGEAHAFVSMGNTGAANAIAFTKLRRIPGVKRPALTVIYPIYGNRIILLDIGANTDCKPEWLAQFAIMGSIYAELVLETKSPRVATLSIGSEDGKGNQLIHDTQSLLRTMPLNYVGNIEPKDMLLAKADVVIVDGFVGNIFIKTFEGSIRYMTDIIREEVMAQTRTKLGGYLMRPALNRVRGRLDTDHIGGAPLLGINGIVIIGHGSASAFAVKNAILQALFAARTNVVGAIQHHIKDMGNFIFQSEES